MFSAHSVRMRPLASLPDLSAAVVDFRLSDTDPVCERLNALAIPFVLYTSYQGH